jgi:hypothetical protein
MKKYFSVSVAFRRDNGNGKIKKVTERYLVDALTVTEAEARVVKYLSDCPDEYTISSASESRIVEVIEANGK